MDEKEWNRQMLQLFCRQIKGSKILFCKPQGSTDAEILEMLKPKTNTQNIV
jgi:hypothetical protein